MKLTTTTLDDLCASADVGRPNILVLDVQGAEMLALRGATRVMSTADCIYAEVNERPLYAGATHYPSSIRFWPLTASIVWRRRSRSTVGAMHFMSGRSRSCRLRAQSARLSNRGTTSHGRSDAELGREFGPLYREPWIGDLMPWKRS